MDVHVVLPDQRYSDTYHVDVTDMRQHRFDVAFSNTSCRQRNEVSLLIFIVEWMFGRYLHGQNALQPVQHVYCIEDTVEKCEEETL